MTAPRSQGQGGTTVASIRIELIDPDANKEIGWVRSISSRLSIDDPSFQESFEAAQLRAARAAYRVLTA